MAKDKKMVDAITSMDEDFAKWYTDICMKAELVSYTSVKGCLSLRACFRRRKTTLRALLLR